MTPDTPRPERTEPGPIRWDNATGANSDAPSTAPVAANEPLGAELRGAYLTLYGVASDVDAIENGRRVGDAVKFLHNTIDAGRAALREARTRLEKADALAEDAVGIWYSFGLRSDVRHSGQILLSRLFESVRAYKPDAFSESNPEEWWKAVNQPLTEARERAERAEGERDRRGEALVLGDALALSLNELLDPAQCSDTRMVGETSPCVACRERARRLLKDYRQARNALGEEQHG